MERKGGRKASRRTPPPQNEVFRPPPLDFFWRVRSLVRFPPPYVLQAPISWPKYPCNRKTYTHLLLFSEVSSPKLTLTLTFLIVSELVLRWCKFSYHAKLAAPKLTLTLPNLFRINSVQTYTYTYNSYSVSFSALRVLARFAKLLLGYLSVTRLANEIYFLKTTIVRKSGMKHP